MRVATDISQLIGQTPIVKLNRLVPTEGADVFVKLEGFNPGGSVKDRIALSMIERAEQEGKLKPGMTIVEPTSGNTGIGLAMIAAAKGYGIYLVMPDTMSIERRKLMAAYGAEFILTPGSEGMKGAVAKAGELASQDGYFMPQQFENSANPQVHKTHTSQEILEQIPDLDAFVAGVGTGGTITGAGSALKQVLKNIKIVAVEPKDSPVISGGSPGPHKIQGIGAGFIPEVLDKNVIDQVETVSNEDAMATARKLAREEGLLLGISSGAAVWAAIQVAERLGQGKKVLVIAPDTGERYLTTELFKGIDE